MAEVNSGQLRWGIVHTDKFWRENVRALEANDFKVLKYVPYENKKRKGHRHMKGQ